MIDPFMPRQPRLGRRRKTSLRAVMDAIFYLLQSGCQWALLPHDFPPKSTVYHYFKRFCRDGTWRRIHDALYCRTRQQGGREEQPSFAIIDSQSVKTGPDARSDIGYDAGKKIKGRKRHILVDTLGMLLKAEVHSAGIQDRDGAALVFDKLANRFPFIEKSAAMAAIGAQRSKRQARDRWRLSNAIKPVSGAGEAMDRRTNAGLARHKPPNGKGFRALLSHKPRLHPNRNDQAHDQKARSISPFLNELLESLALGSMILVTRFWY
ncbi:IS5 family transposase [Rhizobium beringeri]